MVKILELPRSKVVEALRNGEVITSVVGLGHVGLPLATLLATQGTKVIGCVRTEKSAQRIRKGELSITEYDLSIFLREGAIELAALCDACGVRVVRMDDQTFCPYCGRRISVTEFGVFRGDSIAPAYRKIMKSQEHLEGILRKVLETDRFSVSTKTTSVTKQSDVVLVTVGSPIDEARRPNLADLQDVCQKIGEGLQENTLVVLKSTVPPGTTREFVMPILEEESKMKAGLDFGLAFMPETIYEGHALHNFRTLPKIVGGITPRCAKATANFFAVFPAPIYTYEDTSIVEAAKLFMNIYRDVNIALVNELALICECLGVDAIQAIGAANIEKKTHLLTPGLVGGYCLPKDTYHLSHPAKRAGYDARLITQARQINDSMPYHIVKLIEDAFQEMRVPINDSRIVVLGLGFKANSGDLRASPSKQILESLWDLGAQVVAHDPFVEAEEVKRSLSNVQLEDRLEKAVEGSRCTVVVTDHLHYRDLTAEYLGGLMLKPSAVVDARHVIEPAEAVAAKVVFRGLGRPAKVRK